MLTRTEYVLYWGCSEQRALWPGSPQCNRPSPPLLPTLPRPPRQYGCWAPPSAVVSLGATRSFVFREASDFSARWAYAVSNGDAVEMWGDCQERLQHAVRVERRAGDAGPRVSLVFKQRLRRAGGGYEGM